MKNLLIIILLFITLACKASILSDTILFKDIPNNLNKVVTIKSQVSDFDSRSECWYLYFGGSYPDQQLAIVIKKHNGTKRIKLKMDVFLGRKTVCFTGVIVKYNGSPDSSANPEIKKIKDEVETPKPMTLAGQPVMMHLYYIPKTLPVVLTGQYVMEVTKQKQIGRKEYPVQMSMY